MPWYDLIIKKNLILKKLNFIKFLRFKILQNKILTSLQQFKENEINRNLLLRQFFNSQQLHKINDNMIVCF